MEAERKEIARAEVSLRHRDRRALDKTLGNPEQRRLRRDIIKALLTALPIAGAPFLQSITPGFNLDMLPYAPIALVLMAAFFLLMQRNRAREDDVEVIWNTNDTVYRFFDEGFTTDPHGQDEPRFVEHGYDEIADVQYREDAFFLLGVTGHYHVIPKRCLKEGSPERLALLLKEKVWRPAGSVGYVNQKLEASGEVADINVRLNEEDKNEYVQMPKKVRKMKTKLSEWIVIVVVIAVVVGFFALLFSRHKWMVGDLWTLLGAILLSMPAALYASKGERKQTAEQTEHEAFSIRFFNGGFSVRTPGAEPERNRGYLFDEDVHIVETDAAFYLHTGNRKDFVIPKRCMAAGAAREVSELLKEKLEKNYLLAEFKRQDRLERREKLRDED